MQFLKTLFWVVLAVAAMVFAMRNWVPATISLWGGLLVEAKLPVLIYGAFLLGLLPTLVWYHAMRWRLTRRIDSQERALADLTRPMDSVPPITPYAVDIADTGSGHSHPGVTEVTIGHAPSAPGPAFPSLSEPPAQS